MVKLDIEKLVAQAQIANLGTAILNLVNEQMNAILDPLKKRLRDEKTKEDERVLLRRKIYDYTTLFCSSGDEMGMAMLIKYRNRLIMKLIPPFPWKQVDIAVKRAEMEFEIALGFALSRNSYSWMSDIHKALTNQLRSGAGQSGKLSVEDVKELPDKSEDE